MPKQKAKEGDPSAALRVDQAGLAAGVALETGTVHRIVLERPRERWFVRAALLDAGRRPIQPGAARVRLADGAARAASVGAEGRLSLDDVPRGLCSVALEAAGYAAAVIPAVRSPDTWIPARVPLAPVEPDPTPAGLFAPRRRG